ncbi:hypothetical protein [Leadbetterella sp. DM7]|uniref:hypothetical protein n=1 Tax=Leadbetterella sp. DM7 TaxID=3235085 RepID=UPI00349E72B4
MYAVGAEVTNAEGSRTWTGSEWQTNQSNPITNREVASGMPANMAFGMGVMGGFQETGQFLGSLTTTQGWSNLGQGVVNMMQMTSPNAQGAFMRANMGMAVENYIEGIPDMTLGEMAYDLGYGSEKVGEAMLTRKVMPVSKASLGLKVLGKSNMMTTPVSVALQGNLGKLPFRVPTPLNGLGTMSRDVGSILSRNIIIPTGRTIPLQYVQTRK